MPDLPPIETLHAGKYLNLLKRGHWEYASRPGPIDAVAIIATTQNDELILVEQFRIPIGHPTIELPAGLARDGEDNADEELLTAAQRELQEETGYQSDDWSHAFHAVSSGGLTDEAVTAFRARQCIQVTQGGGVDHEDITVHKVKIAELRTWLPSQAQHKRIDARVFAAMAFI